MDDTISRQAAIDALWKALYEYEDETEKQFLESEELDVEDWFQHRIFAQNMSDIDRQVIINLPSAQSEIIRCENCKHRPTLDEDGELNFPTYRCPCQCEDFYYSWMPKDDWFCGNAERRTTC